MSAFTYHLAQLNVAMMRAPLTDPSMADFVAQLQAVNAIADASPGFVWRLQDEAGDATSIRPFADERILVNLSVWESIARFRQFVYQGEHMKVMRDRRRWFEASDQPTLVLWWVPAGHLPSVQEAKERLDHLRQYGSTPYAFSLANSFPSPDTDAVEREVHAVSQ